MNTTMIKDKNGKVSATRVVWTIGMLTVLFVWAFLSIETKVLIHVTVGDAAALGVILGLKPVGAFVEGKNGSPKLP